MTERERIESLLKRKKPDRVPISCNSLMGPVYRRNVFLHRGTHVDWVLTTS